MSLLHINRGNIPDVCHVIIEIPMRGEPVKYEVDKDNGVLWVDRFLGTSMTYPANYGYIPDTLSDDGDPVDVLVVTPVPVNSGAVIPCRMVGLLKMEDEAGYDAKLLAVPISKITSLYDKIETYTDLPDLLLRSIEHFFEHYKDLESNKWAKVQGWLGVDAAHEEIQNSVRRFDAQQTNAK